VLELLSGREHHDAVSHDNYSHDFACFEMVFKSFGPIIDRSRDLGHPRYEILALIHESACRSGPRGKTTSAGIRPLNLAGFVTFGNDWFSFSPHHNPPHRQSVPGFYEDPPTVSTGPRPTALLELPRMQTQGAPPSCQIDHQDYRENGWRSSARVWNSSRGKDVFRCFQSRQQCI
jgi:hypothetical protein